MMGGNAPADDDSEEEMESENEDNGENWYILYKSVCLLLNK